MAVLSDFILTLHRVEIDIREISHNPIGSQILNIFLALPDRGLCVDVNRDRTTLRAAVYQRGAQMYYSRLTYEYGPEIFGYRTNDLNAYIVHYQRDHTTTKIFDLSKIAEKQYEIPRQWAVDYTRLKFGFGQLDLINSILRPVVALEQTFTGHKGKWFRLSKSYIVQTCYVNALFMRYNLPIIPLLLVVSQKSDGSWSSFGKETYDFATDAAHRVKYKQKLRGNNIITDAEIRMAYKLIYEHPSEHMRDAAAKTIFFLEKHYGYNNPTPDQNCTPLNGYVPRREYAESSIKPAIQYDMLDPDVLFSDFHDRSRKGGLKGYNERLAADQPEWVRQQTAILEELYRR